MKLYLKMRVGINIEAEETGKTYEENAKIKAYAIFDKIENASVLADDSGLSIDFFNRWTRALFC